MINQEKKPININSFLSVHVAVIILSFTGLLLSQIFRIRYDDLFDLWQFISILTFIWILWSWYKIKLGIFNPYGLFLLAAFFFNLSPIILSLIPGNAQISLINFFPIDISAQTIIIADLCFVGLHLGALIAVKFSGRKPIRGWTISDRDLTLVGYLLILISIYPLYLTMRESIQLSISLGYNSLYRQSIGTGLLAGPTILADFIVPGVLFLLVASKKNKPNLILSLFLIVGYTVAQLILGKRAVAIMPLIAYVWLWHKTIKPINFGLLTIMSSFFLFFIFPIIRVSRNIAGLSRLSWQTISGLLANTNPFLDVLNEMGSTMQTISHTVQLIPNYRHFDWGMSYFYGLTTIIPNFFWQTHPVIVHGTFGSWLISAINPTVARMGGSIGFSFIAEAYANFGIYGGPIIIALIGYLFVSFSEFVEKSNNKAYLAAIATYLSFFLFFARSESFAIIRPFAWYAVIPLLLCIIIPKLRPKDV